jgi:hypothetical protein
MSIAIFSPSYARNFALSRADGGIFLIVYYARYPFQEFTPGHRIHCRLNVMYENTRESTLPGSTFWLNCNAGSDYLSPLVAALLSAKPPIVRRTGRKRKEISVESVNKYGAEIECSEFEVLITEDGLCRQCYYCLDWEENDRRHHKLHKDIYWCSQVRKLSYRLSIGETDLCSARGKVGLEQIFGAFCLGLEKSRT